MNRKRMFVIPELAACVADSGEDLTEFAPYRKHTLALLRYYFRRATQRGRMVSALSVRSERARNSHSRSYTLEDDAILVCDMERCMASELDQCELKLLALTVWMEQTFERAAVGLGVSERHVRRVYPEMMNRLTRAFSERGLLNVAELREVQRKPMARARLLTLEASAVV